MSRLVRAALGLAALALAPALTMAQAPVLRFNGQFDASVPVNSNLEIRVDATPDAPLYIGFNISAGPTYAFGQALPIGNDAGLYVPYQGGPVPPSGTAIDLVAVPNLLALEGYKVYSLAVTIDPTQPFGFGFSNGATITITRGAQAGPDTAGLVGDPVTLDGSGVLAAGPLPAGFGVQWTIASGPAGHNAQLEGADTLFPTVRADLAGTYAVEMSLLAPGTTGGAVDQTSVAIYAINSSTHTRGGFDPANTVNYQAALAGPQASLFEALGLGSVASGPLAITTPAGDPATSLKLSITDASGQKVGRGFTIGHSIGTPAGTPPADSLAVHVKQVILDQIETLIETALAQVNLGGALTGLPAIPIVNLSFFSATIQLTSFSYDPTIDVELTANAGALNVGMTLTNVVMVFNQTGVQPAGFFGTAPYSDVGTLTIPTLVIAFDMTTSVSNGVYTTSTSNPTGTLTGATLTYQNNSLSSLITNLFLNAFNPLIGGIMANAVALLFPPIIDGALNAIPQQVDLGTGLVLDFPPGGLDYLAGGMTFRINAGAHAAVVDPRAEPLQGIYATGNPVPVYGPTVPGSAQTYTLGIGLGDDFLNSIMAAMQQMGSFEQTIGGNVVLGGTQQAALAGAFALAFPGTGFEKFDPSAAITMVVHPALAPIFTIGQGGANQMQLTIYDLELDIRAESAPGVTTSVLRAGFDATLAVTLAYNSGTGAIDLTPGTPTATVYGMNSMPGIDLAPQLGNLSALIGQLLPTLTSGTISIPIPTITGAPVGTSLVGLQADGVGGDYISLFLN